MFSCAKNVAGSGGGGGSTPASVVNFASIHVRMVSLFVGPPVLSNAIHEMATV